MAEAPYQRDWRPIGDRHGLRISHATAEPEIGDRRSAVHGPRMAIFTILDDDGALVLRHEVPYVLAGDWVAALMLVLDVPTERLPPPERWGEQADALSMHRMDLQALPGTDERDG